MLERILACCAAFSASARSNAAAYRLEQLPAIQAVLQKNAQNFTALLSQSVDFSAQLTLLQQAIVENPAVADS